MLWALAAGIGQVTLVQLQVRLVSSGARLRWIFLLGIAISAFWIVNVNSAISGLGPGAAYALGAGFGSLLAMKIKIKGSAGSMAPKVAMKKGKKRVSRSSKR